MRKFRMVLGIAAMVALLLSMALTTAAQDRGRTYVFKGRNISPALNPGEVNRRYYIAGHYTGASGFSHYPPDEAGYYRAALFSVTEPPGTAMKAIQFTGIENDATYNIRIKLMSVHPDGSFATHFTLDTTGASANMRTFLTSRKNITISSNRSYFWVIYVENSFTSANLTWNNVGLIYEPAP